MTTQYAEMVTCAVCGLESQQTILGSTYESGYMDMDTRPPEMKRSTMDTWVQKCPRCGYCTDDLSVLLDGAQNNVDLPNYRAILTDQSLDALARQFYASSFIKELAHLHKEAGWASLHAAGVCDDLNCQENAIAFRQRAYILFSKIAAEGQTILEQPGATELLLADISRRAGNMQVAMQHSWQGLAELVDGYMRKLLKAERIWAQNKDIGCHTVEDARVEVARQSAEPINKIALTVEFDEKMYISLVRETNRRKDESRQLASFYHSTGDFKTAAECEKWATKWSPQEALELFILEQLDENDPVFWKRILDNNGGISDKFFAYIEKEKANIWAKAIAYRDDGHKDFYSVYGEQAILYSIRDAVRSLVIKKIKADSGTDK